MRTDLLLMSFGARWADMRRAAVAAEDAGFDGLWTYDHLRDPDGDADPGTPEAWTVLSALAEVTRRVALGPLVLNAASRHPGVLANMAATLQTVSGGRLLLGIGAGGSRHLPYAPEFDMIGIPVEADAVRAERVAEAAQVMRRLWTGDASSFEGDHYRLTRPSGFLRPDPPPPIVIGGFGPRMAAIAGRHGDGFNTPARSPRLAELIGVAREAHAMSERPSSPFLVTALASLEPAWLRADSKARASLTHLGVDRVILLVPPPFDSAAILSAGRMLGG